VDAPVGNGNEAADTGWVTAEPSTLSAFEADTVAVLVPSVTFTGHPLASVFAVPWFAVILPLASMANCCVVVVASQSFAMTSPAASVRTGKD
jgi:hypothetical protein